MVGGAPPARHCTCKPSWPECAAAIWEVQGRSAQAALIRRPFAVTVNGHSGVVAGHHDNGQRAGLVAGAGRGAPRSGRSGLAVILTLTYLPSLVSRPLCIAIRIREWSDRPDRASFRRGLQDTTTRSGRRGRQGCCKAQGRVPLPGRSPEGLQAILAPSLCTALEPGTLTWTGVCWAK